MNGSTRMPGSPDRPTREVIESLRRLTLDINRYAHRVARDLGVPATDIHAVGVLHAAPDGLSATELGRLLSLTPSATTSLIDRMEGSGHATRSVSPVDARRARIQPTEVAVDESRTRFAAMNAAVEQVLAVSTPVEAAAFALVLERMRDAVHEIVEHGPGGG